VVIFRLIRSAAAPVNVRLAFCPGVPIVTVCAEPPATIVPFGISWYVV
jgi:hypothetical protein